MMSHSTRGSTVLSRLVSSLRDCAAAPDGWEKPAAILWTDPDAEWQSIMDRLRDELPELIILGPYDPERRTGPAIWLCCMVERTLGDWLENHDVVPILYLPGVSRQDLRAGEACPWQLMPLVPFMYRGVHWLGPGGQEWTIFRFLTAKSGLGLEVIKTPETEQALRSALSQLLDVPLRKLQGRRLGASDFDKLLSRDTIRDLLLWLNNSTKVRESIDKDRWGAFVRQCQSQLSYTPGTDAPTVAVEKMVMAEEAWADVWERFAEAPERYPGVVELLRQLDLPTEEARERAPRYNTMEEASLRESLSNLLAMTHHAACSQVRALHERHRGRLEWVWARLGEARLAEVLQHLAVIADHVESPLGGVTPAEMSTFYTESAWVVDAASWAACAVAPDGDRATIEAIVRMLIQPWLDETARRFQAVVKAHPLPGPGEADLVEAEPGGCILFVDGLRYDLGRMLVQRLTATGYRARIGHRWAARPTVTATAKPAVTPVATAVVAEKLPEDYAAILANGKVASAPNLREAIAGAGYELIGERIDQGPSREDARGWLEAGRIDRLGHSEQERLPLYVDRELDNIVALIERLFANGWQSIRVVTDHGWLWLPGGLPKVDLGKHLTVSRWKRTAVRAGLSDIEHDSYPWYWNQLESFITAPGIAVFNASDAYAHGGLSLQECLLPDLFIESEATSRPLARIKSLTWRGMRCFVEAVSAGAALTVDLRLGSPAGISVAKAAKTLDEDGTANLVVVDDAYETADLVAVLLDGGGNVVAQKATKVGGSV